MDWAMWLRSQGWLEALALGREDDWGVERSERDGREIHWLFDGFASFHISVSEQYTSQPKELKGAMAEDARFLFFSSGSGDGDASLMVEYAAQAETVRRLAAAQVDAIKQLLHSSREEEQKQLHLLSTRSRQPSQNLDAHTESSRVRGRLPTADDASASVLKSRKKVRLLSAALLHSELCQAMGPPQTVTPFLHPSTNIIHDCQ
eukprot:TRINITY_DN4178_c0_g1_i2.p1 TRINITY_DN4178_c0_g1~~TRINITY_DN4178_c0_g1_i2.p1  ORF type:complete len:204 (-),score=59.61 TRINITY_DN4178_c0_g1_i2:11-622(-)